MWIVCCLADNSHEMSRLDFSEKKKKKKNRLLQILLGALRANRNQESLLILTFWLGVVGCGKGVVHLTWSWSPTDIGLSWARPAILAVDKGKGRMFLFALFLHFHSFSSSPVHLLHLFFYLLPFSGRWLKMTHKSWCVVKPQHNILTTNKLVQLTMLWTTELRLWVVIEIDALDTL